MKKVSVIDFTDLYLMKKTFLTEEIKDWNLCYDWKNVITVSDLEGLES